MLCRVRAKNTFWLATTLGFWRRGKGKVSGTLLGCQSDNIMLLVRWENENMKLGSHQPFQYTLDDHHFYDRCFLGPTVFAQSQSESEMAAASLPRTTLWANFSLIIAFFAVHLTISCLRWGDKKALWNVWGEKMNMLMSLMENFSYLKLWWCYFY